MVKKYITFNYNSNDYIESLYYGSDQNGNVWSVINPSTFILYDENGNNIGDVQFQDNRTALESTVNFQTSQQLINELATFNIDNEGIIITSYGFVSDSSTYPSSLVVPTVISATEKYYKKVDEVAINCNADGTRQVWITLKE